MSAPRKLPSLPPLLPLLRRGVRGLNHLLPLTGLLVLAIGATLAGYLLGRKHASAPAADRLEVAVLNVQQGEASWVRTPHGHFIVIGCGPDGQGKTVVASLREAGAKSIDLLILPYPYAEAIGGANDLIAAFPIKEAIEAGGPVVNHWQTDARDHLRQRSVPLQVGRDGQRVVVDGITVEILAPVDPLLATTPATANNSLVLRLRWGHTAFLWAGGLERAGETALLGRAPAMQSDWLRVARMGTGEATSPELLRLVQPRFAVVSVGPNSGGYPDGKTLRRVEASGATLYRTDRQAAPLVFASDGTTVTAPP